MSKRRDPVNLQDMLDEVYAEIPSWEITEGDVDSMYKQYEGLLKREEYSSLDLDFDQ